MNAFSRVALVTACSTLLGLSCASATDLCAARTAATPMSTPHAGHEPSPPPATNSAVHKPEHLYIDMMIPHHASIITLAEAALPRLQDERLQDMAEAIMATQEGEITELQAMREARLGSPDPSPMDSAMLDAMPTFMPDDAMDGHGTHMTPQEMATQMGPGSLLTTFCAVGDPDRAFAELTLAHHQMAVDSSRGLLEVTQDAELRDRAERVIAAQEEEIATLRLVLEDQAGPSPTP